MLQDDFLLNSLFRFGAVLYFGEWCQWQSFLESGIQGKLFNNLRLVGVTSTSHGWFARYLLEIAVCIIVLRNRKVLTLNIKKTKCLPFLFKDSSEPCIKTVILHTCWENVCGQVVKNYKYLGVCLTNKYIWTNVILYIENKMRRIMFFF